MCLTCGCMDAHLKMGERNIRFEDVKAAADENGRSIAETWESSSARTPRIARLTPRSTPVRRNGWFGGDQT